MYNVLVLPISFDVKLCGKNIVKLSEAKENIPVCHAEKICSKDETKVGLYFFLCFQLET